MFELNLFSADVSKTNDKDPEKLHKNDDSSDENEDNNGFAIVIHGHSLVYCLGPELEDL